MMTHLRRLTRTLLVALLCLLLAVPAHAATVLRDTEIEEMIRAIADPIFVAARLRPDDIDIYIVSDPALNAFVAGGQNLFLHSGLLIRAESPEQLAGIIAHETGHIAGGHLTRLAQARGQAGTEALLGALLGIAAAIAGAPQLGTAIMAGGATVAQRDFLSFSRVQEQAADQAGVGYLAAIGLPPQGLIEFFNILESQNLRIVGDGNVYLRTHPLTRERINALEAQQSNSRLRSRALGPALHVAFARSRAKLDGFLSDPQTVLRTYTGDDIPSRYARAAAYHRLPDLAKAIELTDGLIAEAPKDPYFHELKGQVLFESGKIVESVPPYREAVRLKPNSAMIRFGLARALIEQPGSGGLHEAEALLREAVRLEPRNGMVWRTLGIALGRLGDQGGSAMALTEAAVLVGNKRDAEFYVGRAQANVSPSDPSWLRLQDLVRQVAEMEEPKPRSRRF